MGRQKLGPPSQTLATSPIACPCQLVRIDGAPLAASWKPALADNPTMVKRLPHLGRKTAGNRSTRWKEKVPRQGFNDSGGTWGCDGSNRSVLLAFGDLQSAIRSEIGDLEEAICFVRQSHAPGGYSPIRDCGSRPMGG
uniref:Uncharacterized protein n=1 Tax=Physcomitrium patens TaxID=3218 RepID=A0A2K1KCB8_PHYPA|nr:hypothetical protein PHYPA_010612 [Physcomitrium patens]